MKQIHVYQGKTPSDPVIYLNVFDGDGASVWEACRIRGDLSFTLVAVGGLHWDAELSPWQADPVFRGDDFRGLADRYLEELTQRIIPETEAGYGLTPVWRGIGGIFSGGTFCPVYSVQNGYVPGRRVGLRLLLVPGVC